MAEPALIRAITREIGGSPLARRALSGGLPEWYASRPKGESGWSAAAEVVSTEFAGSRWLEALVPAFGASGAALDRLSDSAHKNGIVVTGGQQPGLFGGPLYVLNKAITLLEMANALALATGRPVAPVFWAATDDADFAEASHVSVVRRGCLDALAMDAPEVVGLSMARTPLGDVSAQYERLAEACGSAPAAGILSALRTAYSAGATVGGAYLSLLRSVLEPLGVAVLDASHESVRRAGHETMLRALAKADGVADALSARSREIASRDLRPQVADVRNLSLVFETAGDGTRQRIPVSAASAAAKRDAAAMLGPNVLLRPVMERQILPTVCYIGGAGEVAYFAQVSAVAEALGVAVPRIVPRWSGTLMESHIESLLGELDATMDDFVDPHAMEGRVAREGLSHDIRSAIGELHATVDAVSGRLRNDSQTSEPLARSIGSMRAGVEHRLARLERRYAAAVKRAGSDALRSVELVRATLYPQGEPQERVLSFVPFLARYGSAVIDTIRTHAHEHVAHVIQGD
ncbi:MAG: bacillithiol biosynthesis BshC [Gemmatimonadaceae bacterium]